MTHTPYPVAPLGESSNKQGSNPPNPRICRVSLGPGPGRAPLPAPRSCSRPTQWCRPADLPAQSEMVPGQTQGLRNGQSGVAWQESTKNLVAVTSPATVPALCQESHQSRALSGNQIVQSTFGSRTLEIHRQQDNEASSRANLRIKAAKC